MQQQYYRLSADPKTKRDEKEISDYYRDYKAWVLNNSEYQKPPPFKSSDTTNIKIELPNQEPAMVTVGKTLANDKNSLANLKKSIIKCADVFAPTLGKCRDIDGLVPVSPILVPEYHSKIKQTHQKRKWPLNQATDFIEGMGPMLKDDILELTKDAPIHSISAYFMS